MNRPISGALAGNKLALVIGTLWRCRLTLNGDQDGYSVFGANVTLMTPTLHYGGESRGKDLSMILVNRRYRSVCAVLALLIGPALVIAAVSAQEKLADLKPLVGKWGSEGSGNVVSIEMTINEDGTYSRVSNLRAKGRSRVAATDSATGTLELVDGTVHFKNSKGVTGTVELYVDATGKRTLKFISTGGVLELERRN